MSDLHPFLRVAALAVPLLTGIGVWLYVRRRRRVARALGDAALARRLTGVDLAAVPWGRACLVLGAAAALGAALTDPRWGEVPDALRTGGTPLVAVVDVSNSMLARDGLPDRLSAAKATLQAVARENDGRPIGIVAFAGHAVALTPPTVDRDAIELFIAALHPEMATQTGSAVIPALRQGLALLTLADVGGLLLLISDGDTSEEVGAAVDLARAAGRAGIPIFTAGTGTVTGAPVPDIDFRTGQQVGFKLERSGETAISRLDEPLLEGIARASGGEYSPIRSQASAEMLASRIAGAVTRGRGAPSDPREPRFAWFAALALVLLVGDALARHPRGRIALPTAMGMALLLAAGCRGPEIGPDAESADELIRDFREEVARDPTSLQARYNLGTALLLYGRYDEARANLEPAGAAEDSILRQHARYNAGNADLSPAFEGVAQEPRERVLRRAIEAYKQALLVDPNDRDAKWNLELARRLLEQPPSPPPPDPTPDAGEGGGGAGGDGGTADPQPQTAAPGQGSPQMSPEAADRILSGAQERELATQQERLTRPQPRDPYAH